MMNCLWQIHERLLAKAGSVPYTQCKYDSFVESKPKTYIPTQPLAGEVGRLRVAIK